MTVAPTLAKQIVAVEFAIERLNALKTFLWELERRDEPDTMRPLAEAAEKVLATLEMDRFARETLK